MEKIPQVDVVEAHRFSQSGLNRVHILAVGKVPTSGWSNVRLSPTYYIVPPSDGIWEFALIGDPPVGMVLEVITPVSSEGDFAAPDWMKGINVNGVRAEPSEHKLTSVQTQSHASHFQSHQAQQSHAIVRQGIAAFDDSFNPIGLCGGFSVKMKKLSHNLTLVVEGPDESRIRDCIGQATGIGLVAAIVAVYATGGGALSAATSAFLASLQGCLGDSFSVKLDDESHWVEWCT